MTGHIKPRLSWPRSPTPTDLTPSWAGEFQSFDDWVGFATQRLTGTYDPMTGAEVQAVCIDAIGRRCTIGAHFMRARDERTFPVRFFWDCLPISPEGRRVVSVSVLAEIMALLPPPPMMAPDGRTFEFHDPEASKRLLAIRALFERLLVEQPDRAVDKVAAEPQARS